MKKLVNCLAYVVNLLVALVLVYAALVGLDVFSFGEYAWLLVFFLGNVENVVLRYKVNKLES